MAIRLSCLVLLFGLTLVGSADAKQDKGEIPATIGNAADAVQDRGKPHPVPAATQSASATTLESAPQKQDLATLLRKEKEEFAKQTIDIPSSWKRMWKDSHIWADVEKKQVIVRGAICIDDGLLEMFACPRGTKEHESVISIHGNPAHGTIMNIEVWWNDETGKLVKRRAQDMIRNTDTGKAMDCDFVFGGSDKRYDPYEEREIYFADDGPMINVANQPDAMIDVSIQSSQAAQGSLFETFTENVPAVNTKVYIVLSASDKKVDALEGKPTREQLRKEDEIRRAEMEKRMEELDRKWEAEERARKAKAEKESQK